MSQFPDLKHEDTKRLVLGFLFVALVSAATFLFSPPSVAFAAILASFLAGMLLLMHYHRSTAQQMVKLSEHIQDLHFLHSSIKLRKPLPYLTSWSASPALAARLFSLIHEEKPETIVELGSGVSTVVMAYAVEQVGKGRILSLDHDAAYAEKTRAELKRHHLDHLATVIHAPLVATSPKGETASGNSAPTTSSPSAKGAQRWYDLSEVPDLGKIDMLIVDGPPRSTCKDARLPAFDQLASFLSPGGVIVIDDSARACEHNSVAAWSSISEPARSEYIPCEKGVSVRFLR